MWQTRMRWLGVLAWMASIVLGVGSALAQEAQDVSDQSDNSSRDVYVLQIEGPVTPIMISYIERGIETDPARLLGMHLVG